MRSQMGRVHKPVECVYGPPMWTILKNYGPARPALRDHDRLDVLFPAQAALHAESGPDGNSSRRRLAFEDVRLTNGLGTPIHAWWLPHDRPRFTLLFSHGNGGNMAHRLESLRIFHDLGLSVLIYDYSGYGQSQGVPGEKATHADARAAWDWLVHERDIDPGSIILFGRSLGGGVDRGTGGTAHQTGRETGRTDP